MRKVVFITTFVIVIISSFCSAYSGQFYTYSGKFYSRTSGLCPSGNVVQAIVHNGSTSVPPSPFYPYLGPGEKISSSHQRCKTMGTDLLAEYFFGDGNLGSLNSGNSPYSYGYMRAFSGKFITESAYFVNTPCEPLHDDTGPPSDNDIDDIAVNIVNPAYKIPFDMPPTNGNDIGIIIGSVFSTKSGNNNILESGWILVEWRFENSQIWHIGDSSLTDNGDFKFVVDVPNNTNIYIRARVKDNATPLNGFPVSREFKIYVLSISAFDPIIVITNNSPLIVDFGTVEKTIGGTTAYIIGGLNWSNSLVVSSHFAYDFPINISDLQVGENVITVYGSNRYDKTTSDCITIIRKEEPLPEINITTPSPLYVDFGTTEVLINGTSKNIAGGLSWIKTDGSISGTASNFPITITGLSVGENIIIVSGTNRYGTYAQDIISIIRQEEPLPEINITNTSPLYVDFGTTEALIYGTSKNIAGGLSWIKTDGTASGFSFKFPITVTNLFVGENIIVVYGTNCYGRYAQDIISIVRQKEPLPLINITNPSPLIVGFKITEQVIGGIVSNIAGNICWSNSLVYGINCAASFPISISDLLVGENIITVFGTNIYGTCAKDSISIIRAENPIPEIYITNTSPITVCFAVTNQIIGGTSRNISGYLSWSNSLVPGINFAPNFPINVFNLQIGNNVISVFGTNIYGVYSEDAISIIRKPEPIPFINITNSSPVKLDFFTTKTVIGTTNINIAGNLAWFNNRVNYTNWCNGYDLTITNLQPGANIITVIGTNIYGTFAADTIEIDRLSKPVVDICTPTTNKVWTANAKLMLIGGNLFDAAGFADASLIISNETSSSWFYTTPTANWGPELTEVSFPTNIIKAIYCNRFGERTTDYIKVINGPPPSINLIHPANHSIFASTNVSLLWEANYTHFSQKLYINDLCFGLVNSHTNIILAKGFYSWWITTPDDAGKIISSVTNYFEIADTKKTFVIWQAGIGFDDGSHGGASFNWSQLAPTNSLIQIIGSRTPEFPLPLPNNILASNNYLVKNAYIGHGKNLLNNYSPGAGEFAAAMTINYPSNKYIVVRSYSSSNVNDSAYFDQSSIFTPWNFEHPYPLESLVNIFINPAYIIPDSEVFFPDTEPENNLLPVYGFPPTGYDDNQLRDYDINIEWKNLSLNTSGFFTISYNKFSGKIPIITNNSAVITNQIAIRTVGFSEIPELPASNWQHFYIPNFLPPAPPEIVEPVFIEPGCSNVFITTNNYIYVSGYKKQKNECLLADKFTQYDIVQSCLSTKWSHSFTVEYGDNVFIKYYSTNILGESDDNTLLIIEAIPEPTTLLILIMFIYIFVNQSKSYNH